MAMVMTTEGERTERVNAERGTARADGERGTARVDGERVDGGY